MNELKQKDIDELLNEMEKISPKVKELVLPIRLLPKRFQEYALLKLYAKTKEWKQDCLVEKSKVSGGKDEK